MLSTTSDYLLFHALTELFAVVVAFGIFIVAWNTRRFAHTPFFLLVGVAFAAVGGFDLLHALAYKGMGTAVTEGAEFATKLWVAARFTETAAVFLGVALVKRTLPAAVLVGGFGGYVALVAAAMALGLFPQCYVDGIGQTPFKIAAEYAFIAAKLATAALLVGKASHFDLGVRRLLFGYLAVSALSEAAFTNYVGVYDGANQLGHVLKVVAYVLLYRATVGTALVAPYKLLFRDLAEARDRLAEAAAERGVALRQTRGTLVALVQASPLAIVALDAEHRVTLWNPAAQALFGWDAGEVLGRPLPTAPPDERTAQSEMLTRILAGSSVHGVELTRWRKDGTPIVVRSFGAPFNDGDGKPCGIMFVAADITEEREARRAVRTREERLRGVMDNVPDAILTVNEQGLIESCNRAAEKLFGYTAEEMVGRNVAMLMPSEVGAQHDGYIAAYVGGGDPRLIGHGPRETIAKRRDGSEVTVDMALNEMEVDGRRLFIGVLRDIEQRLRARRHRDEMERELVRAQRMEALGNLAGGIAHEVNNMLVPIMGLTELSMQRLSEDSPIRSNLDKVMEAAGRAREILRQIMTFSRAEQIAPAPIPLCGVLRNACALLRVTVPLGVTVQQDIPDEEILALGTPLEVHQIVMNLGRNAVDAIANEYGRIDLRLHRADIDEPLRPAGLPPGAYAVIDFTDDGVGMSADMKEKIFQPFFTTKGVGEGSGMGLAVVHGIVTNWGGAITVDSRPGIGTTFRIHLPLPPRERSAATLQAITAG